MRFQYENSYYGVTNPPYRAEYYPSLNDTTMDCVYTWDGNYEVGHFSGGSKKTVQTAQQIMGFPEAWKRGFTGKGVKVCVIDGGLSSSTTHKDITIQGNYNYYLTNDEDHTMQMVSGIAARNNGGSGVIGNAYDADIYIGNYYDIVGSINWGLANGCRVFSCSFNIQYNQDPDPAIMAAFAKAVAANCAVIIAAGNNKSTVMPILPYCAAPGTISVAAQYAGGIVQTKDSLYTVNVLGLGKKYLDFAAPVYLIGASNKSTVQPAGDYYGVDGGSSTSTEELTGVYTLMIQRFPTVKMKVITEMIKAHAHSFYSNGVVIRIPYIGWIR